METETISKEHYEILKEYLKGKNGETEVYWSYNDKLTDEQVIQIIKGKKQEVQDEIWEGMIDHICDLEKHLIEEAIRACNLEDSVCYFDVEDLRDYCSIKMDIETLIRNTGPINVRFHWYSNYDCINSFWLESQSGYSYEESYFGAMVDALQLNPSEVKKLLTSKGVRTNGRWPNKKRNPYVTYTDFYRELENQSCGACLLTIVGTVDLNSFDENCTKFEIPKQNCVGLFSSWQGGGSPMDMELQRPIIIDTKKFGKSEYDHWGIQIDSDDGYSIDNAYGVTKQFWGGEIKLLKY